MKPVDAFVKVLLNVGNSVVISVTVKFLIYSFVVVTTVSVGTEVVNACVAEVGETLVVGGATVVSVGTNFVEVMACPVVVSVTFTVVASVTDVRA